MISKEEIKNLYQKPLLDLVFEAASVHREHHNHHEMQLCTLLSIKTGGCPEDCSYCPQAARYHTDLERQKLLDVDTVFKEAQKAKAEGSTRFCMGAAWREVKDNKEFDQVIEMVKKVNTLDMEVCATLGMLTASQAKKLADAGLTAYNHNIDTSPDFYSEIIKTRTYDDRLDTINNVSKAGISVCSGGIIGMGESEDDRIDFLYTLSNLDPQPESVPINSLVPVEGTPLENQKELDPLEWIRMIALARILMPKAMVRLSAGRLKIPKEAQAMAFLAGANSIFTGEKLLTTGNPCWDFDHDLLNKLGLTPKHSTPKKVETPT